MSDYLVLYHDTILVFHCRTQKDEKDIELGLDFQRREKIGNFVVAIHT